MTILQPVKPGLSAPIVTSIPDQWSKTWFRSFITNYLQNADIRNAVTPDGGGVQVSASNFTQPATISFSPIPNNTVYGNVSGTVAPPVAITPTQLTTLINVFTTGIKGAVPPSPGGVGQFLRADGNWAGLSLLASPPTALVGLTAVDGTANSFMSSDSAPALDQSIAPTWTGTHTFLRGVVLGTAIGGNRGDGSINAQAYYLNGLPFPSPSRGPAGKDGRDGKRGASGVPGVAGSNGTIGHDGRPGRNGRDGLDGKRGPPGISQPGSTGTTGAQGLTGRAGRNGKDGLDGRRGPSGLPGAPGVTGAQGLTGRAGRNGKDGLDGRRGPPGLTGGVSSVTGTANQIAAAPTIGAVVLSFAPNVIIPAPPSGIALVVNASSTPGNAVSVTGNVNTGIQMAIINTSTGIAAGCQLDASNGTDAAIVEMTGTGSTASLANGGATGACGNFGTVGAVPAQFFTNDTFRGGINGTTGAWTLAVPTTTATITLTVNGAANAFVVDLAGSTTATQSKGLRVRAGTGSTAEVAFAVNNAANSASFFVVNGAGQSTFGGPLSINAGTPTAAPTGYGTPSGAVTASITGASTLAQVAGTLGAFLAYMKTIGFVAT